MVRPRLAALLVVIAAISGCKTALVFSKPFENSEPHVAPAENCPVNPQTSISDIIGAADEKRDLFMDMKVQLSPVDLGAVEVPPDTTISCSFCGARQQQSTIAKRFHGQYLKFLNDSQRALKLAESCYVSALKQDPSQSYAYLNLAVMEMRMADLVFAPGKRDEYLTYAQNYLGRAREHNPYDAQTVYYQAELELRRGQYQSAEKLLHELVDKRWERAHVHNLLGYLYELSNRLPEAQAEWRLSTAIDTPPEANHWAVERLRPLQRLRSEEKDPDLYYRWNEDVHDMELLVAPLPPECGWDRHGRPRC
jgi:tetratricopeptide (TPR) repeat protein